MGFNAKGAHCQVDVYQTMQFRFEDDALEELYYENKGAAAYPEGVISAFFKKMQLIRNAKHEGDLRNIKGNHFEKLQGNPNTYSMRLNDQYRLIFGLDKEGGVTIVAIREISNHYA